jgi:hypothetical protein
MEISEKIKTLERGPGTWLTSLYFKLPKPHTKLFPQTLTGSEASKTSAPLTITVIEEND